MGFKDERGTGLAGSMIPRTTGRLYNQRGEERYGGVVDDAVITARGRQQLVRVINISAEGAMIAPALALRIGEPVTLRLPGEIIVKASVRWIRSGRIGLNFADPLCIEAL